MIPMFKFRLVLNLVFLISVLCVSCRSSRTGTLSTAENIRTARIEGYERLTDREELMQMLSIHRDSLYIRITEYYPPESGDTVAHGPIRSETEIHYSSTDTTKKIVSTVEAIQERDSIAEKQEVDKSTHQETKVTTRPWFDNWQFYLIGAAVIIIIVMLIIRRFT